jgi:hypothetical protein
MKSRVWVLVLVVLGIVGGAIASSAEPATPPRGAPTVAARPRDGFIVYFADGDEIVQRAHH